MRIIGIDFGERRIGVASADDRLRIALPLETVEAGDDPVGEIVRIAEEQHADALVIGLPLSLSGAEGPQAATVREAASRVEERLAIPVHLHDERLTTRQAVSVQPGGNKRRTKGSDNRDAVAASILLQSFLDNQRPYG
jgi:putative Holliday junction resolvase